MTGGGRRWVIGLDGGGTATRIAVADGDGRELLRRTGPAGRVDPGRPAASADTLIRLVRDTAAEADLPLPASALCAGLAGVGATAPRDHVRSALAGAGIAERIAVVPDGEIALEGALAGAPGILLIAGTGSGAWGRGENDRIARCGGWGMVVGDEGSGYAMGRAALRAALHAADGRGESTTLLPDLLGVLAAAGPEELAAWAGSAEKAEIAALAPLVMRAAQTSDGVAEGILETAARDLARHVEALIERLAPWSAPVPVVFHGGALGGGALEGSALAERVEARLHAGRAPVDRREAAADAVAGAVRMSLAL